MKLVGRLENLLFFRFVFVFDRFELVFQLILVFFERLHLSLELLHALLGDEIAHVRHNVLVEYLVNQLVVAVVARGGNVSVGERVVDTIVLCRLQGIVARFDLSSAIVTKSSFCFWSIRSVKTAPRSGFVSFYSRFFLDVLDRNCWYCGELW